MAPVQQFVNQGNVHFSDNISSRVQVGNSFGSHIFFDQPVLGDPVLDEPATFDAADLHNEPAVAADAPAAEETPAVVETASVIPAVETTEPLPIRTATPAIASPEETTLTKQGVQGLPGPPGHPGHVTLADLVKIQTIEGTFPLRALAPGLKDDLLTNFDVLFENELPGVVFSKQSWTISALHGKDPSEVCDNSHRDLLYP